MDVSIIIVSYNTIDLIGNCVDSVFEKTEGVDYEIIVVDNQSPDDTVNVLKEKYGSEPNFRLIELQENIGFGRANNEAFKIAQGRNVLLLNPDTVLINNAIKILSDYLDANPKVGICGGNLFDEEMKPAYSYGSYLPGMYAEFNMLLKGKLDRLFYRENTTFNQTDKNTPVAYISGADLMTRKVILDEMGGFNPSFFMYYEETELTYRIKKAGYRVMNVPKSEIQHLERRSFSGFKEKRERLFFEGRLTYCQLTMGCLKRFLIKWMHYVNLNINVTFHTFRHKEMKSFWQMRRDLYKEIFFKQKAI